MSQSAGGVNGYSGTPRALWPYWVIGQGDGPLAREERRPGTMGT